MRTAAERTWPSLAGLVACFCAFFFGRGLAEAPLVWIGGLALVTAAASLLVTAPHGLPAAAFLGCLWGLALWCGLSILWSASPDGSWSFTNRTLAYAAFATLGVVVGPALDGAAAAATALVGAVVGWALLAKCIPALYGDYGRVARLRAPLEDWNMLALVCVAGVAFGLWLGARARVAGGVLVFLSAVALLLTYSRFGVALACAAALAWLLTEPDRVEALATLAASGGLAIGAFGVALGLNGITSDGESHATRVHDGWIFLLVLLAGAVLAATAGAGIDRLRIAPERRRAVERAAALAAVVAALAGLAFTLAKAGTIWHEFTNPVGAQISNNVARLGRANAGNRWAWWQEAWHGFTGHPLGGTGAGTFRFTDLRLRASTDITALEPHNTPLQFLSETGIVGFLLYLGGAAAALAAAWRRRGPLAIAVAAFFVHSVVNYDWSFVGICGPFLFAAGVLVAQPARDPVRDQVRVRRPLLAAAAVAFSLACVYSLAAPWLATRAEASATGLSDLNRAHSYDPLNTDIIVERAAFQSPAQAERSYRDAVSLEPTNANIWFELATFYATNSAWHDAYAALSKAYRYDPYGPAGQCGISAQIRRHVGVHVTCRGAG